MSSRPKQPVNQAVNRPVLIALCLMLIATAMAVAFAATADAAYYKMVACAGNNGVPPYATATNTIWSGNPQGIFEFHNWCGGQGGDPPGNSAYLRINEDQASGNAGQGAYGDIIWDTPNYVHWKAAGGYTREVYSFNDGWRARFWIVDFQNQGIQLFTQGAGVANAGITTTFAPHLWPFGSYLDFHRLVFELECVRPAGCDRTNYNSTDANGFVFILSDDSNSQVGFTNTGAPLLAGQWVRGAQNVTFNVADQGSGLRWERMRIGGAQRWAWDHGPECNVTWSQTNGEWARSYQPCPVGGPWGRSVALDTSTLSDGAHDLSVCTQDFGQYQGLNGTGGESCDRRTIRLDNTAPGAPSGLRVTSANPARYLDRFGAQFSLPPNEGSPIARAHYQVINPAGSAVGPVQTLSATNPTEIAAIEGPAQAGDYRLKLWLEDSVGLSGPPATAQIPHDTTPPAAPQDVSVAAPSSSRAAQGFDLRWRDIADAGSPIDAVHYQILNGSGAVSVPTQTVSGQGVQAIPGLDAPEDRGAYTLRLWLSDAEGNVGAAVSVPLAYDCVRSQAGGGVALTSGLGGDGAAGEIVQEGSGSLLHGSLRGAGGAAVANASLCVFSRVVTDSGREFLGIALTGQDGGYRFGIQPGASRELSVVYRPDHRELTSYATLETVVHPSFAVRRKVVYNEHLARFSGRIPGPDNNGVVVVLQVKRGRHGWLAFRRYSTRNGGRFKLAYKFMRTHRRTRYVMRAQVRQTVGYPYRPGDSRHLRLLVLPHRHRHSHSHRPRRHARR
jgi:hypothetical protein